MIAPRLGPLLASALCLSACAAGPPGAAVGRYPAGADGAGADGGPVLASLPAAAGRLVAVRRIPYANGVGQEIVLDGPRAMSGENLITVEALTTAATGLRGQGAEELKIGPATDTEIAAEMDRALPGVAMRLAAAPEQDEEGAIGYATGTAGRLSCVYAWQYLAPARPLSLLEGAAGTGALPLSVRVRLCREQPAAALVAALRGLRVFRPDGSAGPAGPSAGSATAPPGDALAAAVGSPPPVAARDGSGVDADVASAPAEPVRPTRRPSRPRHRFAAVRPRAAAHPTKVRRGASIRRGREPSGDLAAVPRVPMPGDAPTDAAPPRPPAARSAAVDPGLPMPR